MTETAPAAVAAPAAPVAAPAPASAPAPAPAAVATTPVLTAPDAGSSLIDVSAQPVVATTPAIVPAAPVVPTVLGKSASGPNNVNAWNLNDTVPGVGEKPSWFKSDKYANVAKQAEAYTALEQRFGAFTGAPKEGYQVPQVEIDGKPAFAIEYEGARYTIQTDHPQIQAFNKLAAEMQLSQDGYTKLLGLMGQYEASQAPDISEAKAALGPNADRRIETVVNWAKANLDANGFQLMRAVTAGHEAAPAFALLEQLIAKTGQVRMPAPGDDVVAASGTQGLAGIQALQGKKGADGKRLYETDANHRRAVDAAYQQYYTANPVQRDRQGNVRG